jgi:hypothetical protein
MAGASYNAVLIVVPLIFWAGTRWRSILAWAIREWRQHRANRPGVSPSTAAAAPLADGPQVTPPTGPAGEGLRRASEGGPEEGAGKRPAPLVETRGDGVTGAWIRVDRAGGDA